MIAAIAFWLIKRKRADKEKKQCEIDEYGRQKQINEPVMEVNWDEIEKKYAELPMSHKIYSTHSLQIPDDIAYVGGDSGTKLINPMLIQRGNEVQCPDAIEGMDFPDVRNYKL